MALTRQGPSVGVQLQSSFPIATYGMDSVLQAQTFQNLGNTASSLFDMVKRDYDHDAVKQAQIDAPALIKRDGTGLTMPVSSFEPPGLTSKAYREAYMTFGQNLYSTSVETDYSNFLNNVATQHPTDLPSARTAMEERRNQVVAGLDKNVAPLITLRLNALSGQLESRINANVQAEQNKVADENALREGQGVILDAAKLARTPDRFDAETLGINHQMLTGRFTRATEFMKSAGWSEARISKYWQDAKLQTEIARDSQQVRNVLIDTQGASTGDMERAQLGILAEMERRRIELGPDGPAYYRAMQEAFGQFTQRNGIAIHLKELEAVKKVEVDTAAGKKALADLEGQKDTPLWTAQIAKIRDDRNAALTDPSLSASQRLKRYAAMNSVLGETKSEFTDLVAGQMTQLYTQATTPTGTAAGAQRAQAARYELEQIVGDPNITRHLPVGVRNYGERAIASIIADETKTDVSMGMQHGLSGSATLEGLIDQGKGWVARGIIGNGPGRVMSVPEYLEYYQKARGATLVRDAQRRAAELGLDKLASGQMPSEAENGAMAERMGGLVTPNGEALDLTKPGHSQAVINRFSAINDLAPEAVAALKNVPMGANPAASAAAAATYQGLESVLADRGMKPNQRSAVLGAKLGHDVVSFLKNVPILGHDLAVQEMRASTGTSSTGQAGGPIEQTAKDVSLGMDAALKSLGPGAEPGLWARTFGSLDRKQEATRRILGSDAPTLGGLILNQINPAGANRALQGGTWGSSGTYLEVTSDPEYRREVEKRAAMILRRDGKAMKAANKGQDINELAVLTAMESLRDETEIAPDPTNPSKGVMGFVSAEKRLATTLGYSEPVSQEQNRLFSLGLFRQHEAARVAAGLPPSLWADFDQSSVRLQRFRDPDTGAMTWVMAANHKNSPTSVQLMEMGDNDPRLSAFVGDLKNNWAHHLRDKWYNRTPQVGPQQDQPPLPPETELLPPALVAGGTELPVHLEIEKMTGIGGPFDRGRAVGPDVDAFLAGSFAGKLGAMLVNSTKDVVSSVMLNRYKERLLQQLADQPENHFTKGMFDAIFGTDTARTMGVQPLVNVNPLDIMPTFPSNPDWKRIREAVGKANDPRMEEKARALQFMFDRNATPDWLVPPPVKK